MLKTYLYIPDELNERIEEAARAQKKSKAEIIRNTLDKNIDKKKSKKPKSSGDLLLKLADLGKKYKDLDWPKDLSQSHDKYLWDKNKT